jgi:tight adherence protein C
VLLLPLVVVSPLLGLAVGLGAVAWRRQRRATRARSDRAVLVRSLPDAIDLLLLATEAGLPLPLAHPIVAARCPEPLAGALAEADDRSAAGAARADALVEALTPLGGGAAALGHVLADHLRYGTPLGPALEARRVDARTERRHAIEEAARQVPVRLLGPLLLCVLPAFGALTVIPLLLASLDALPS